jgi:hypothetical protein
MGFMKAFSDQNPPGFQIGQTQLDDPDELRWVHEIGRQIGEREQVSHRGPAYPYP